MTGSARAAAIRGDDYQHLFGWRWACRMLNDRSIESVTIEDREGGAFDDVVIRRQGAPDIYVQLKSSVHGDVQVTTDWLLTSTTKNGKSPLGHFYATYADLLTSGEAFELEFRTNRGFDPEDPLIGRGLDRKDDRVDADAVLAAGPRSALGGVRRRWAEHLGISQEDLAVFLRQVRWIHMSSEAEQRDDVAHLMQLVGLRSNEDAVLTGVTIVREWVSTGLGPRTAENVRSDVAAHDLLASADILQLVIDAFERSGDDVPANVRLDFVDLHEGHPKLLADQGAWNANVWPELKAAEQELEQFGDHQVHIGGHLRLPMWFATGAALAEVRNWRLSMMQSGECWRTDTEPVKAPVRVLHQRDIEAGAPLTIAIALTHDMTDDIERHLASEGSPFSRLTVLGPDDHPSPTSVPGDGWARSWARAAREIVRTHVQETRAEAVNLYFGCPAGVALMLGHQWNVLPETTLWEYSEGRYHPTFSLPATW